MRIHIPKFFSHQRPGKMLHWSQFCISCCCFVGISDTKPTNRGFRVQGKYFFSCSLRVAGICLEMIVAGSGEGEGPHLAGSSRHGGFWSCCPGRSQTGVEGRPLYFLGFEVLEQVMWLNDSGGSRRGRRRQWGATVQDPRG